jgi:hypothetical protein
MFKRLNWLIILSVAMNLLGATVAFSQTDSPPADPTTYELVQAFFFDQPGQTFTDKIEVAFGKNFPKGPGLAVFKTPDNWRVRTVALKATTVMLPSGNINEVIGDERYYVPKQVVVNEAGKFVTLSLDSQLDRDAHKVTVIFRQFNYPEVTIGPSPKTGGSKIFTSAKGKEDADIYFSGTAAAAQGAKPLYNFESKIGYLQSLRRYGSIGVRGTVDAAKETNIDPDSITANGTYEKVFVFAPATGIILKSDFLGGEFDKGNETRNLTTKLDAILVLRSAPISETAFATMDFTLGFEGGHNFRHKLDTDGLGGFWRWKLGANAYLVALNALGLNRINVSAEYKVRLMRSAEPFTKKIGDDDVTILSKKPRHHVGINTDFMFSKAFGITMQYRYGTLPPAFKFVDHSVSAGITFKLKQANK